MRIYRFLLVFACFYSSLLGAVVRLYPRQAEDGDAPGTRWTQSAASNSFLQWDPGGYELNLGVGKPTFNNLKEYNELYGQTTYYPSFAVTYKLGRLPYTIFGAGIKLSFYSANGHAVRESGGQFTVDPSGPTSLTLFPYQIYLSAQVLPFNNRYVVFNFSLGYEELYYEEVRLQSISTATSTQTTTTPTTTPKANTAQPAQDLVNSGWNKSLSFSIAVDFLLNQFDEKSPKSLAAVTGLGFIYVAPFVEFTTSLGGGRLFLSQQNASSVNFSRTTYGILFMFET